MQCAIGGHHKTRYFLGSSRRKQRQALRASRKRGQVTRDRSTHAVGGGPAPPSANWSSKSGQSASSRMSLFAARNKVAADCLSSFRLHHPVRYAVHAGVGRPDDQVVLRPRTAITVGMDAEFGGNVSPSGSTRAGTPPARPTSSRPARRRV